MNRPVVRLRSNKPSSQPLNCAAAAVPFYRRPAIAPILLILIAACFFSGCIFGNTHPHNRSEHGWVQGDKPLTNPHTQITKRTVRPTGMPAAARAILRQNVTITASGAPAKIQRSQRFAARARLDARGAASDGSASAPPQSTPPPLHKNLFGHPSPIHPLPERSATNGSIHQEQSRSRGAFMPLERDRVLRRSLPPAENKQLGLTGRTPSANRSAVSPEQSPTPSVGGETGTEAASPAAASGVGKLKNRASRMFQALGNLTPLQELVVMGCVILLFFAVLSMRLTADARKGL